MKSVQYIYEEKKMSIQNTLNELNSWLAILIKYQGTDLHVKSNALVRARVKGSIVPINKNPIPEHIIEGLVKSLMRDRYHSFDKIQEFDGTYTYSNEYRFRVNIYLHYGGYALNFRLIPQDIKTIEELNLPTQLHKLSKLERGLVLVTGTTGSGKSTLLASIIDEINKNSRKHIITIEDPIEYIYNDKKSIVEQREIGQHTHSFSKALRSAMREDPDVVMI